MLTRPDPPQRLLRSRSARERLKFSWERFSKISPELPKLFKLHWKELAVDQDTVPLDPDWEFYRTAEARGVLFILTARAQMTGKLAGYCFNMVGPHAHYNSTRFAHTEMFYLHPHFRKGWQPVNMLKENLKGLKVLGAEVATINFKLSFESARVGKLLARLEIGRAHV